MRTASDGLVVSARWLAILPIAVLLLASTAEAQGFEQFRRGIVRIEDRSSGRWGTGFVVDDRCTFATAKHVIAKANKDALVIRFQLPTDPAQFRQWPVRVLFEFQEDIAFLRIDTFNKKPCESGAPMHVFRLAEGPPASNLVGAAISIIGFPQLGASGAVDIPVLRKGHMSAVEILIDEVRYLLLDLPGVPDFSGSPLNLDATGEVLGIVHRRGPTERRWGFEWATPVTAQDYEKAVKSQSGK